MSSSKPELITINPHAHAQVVIACASKQPAHYFQRSTFLGRSLKNFPSSLKPRLVLLPDNKGQQAVGLAEFYNRVIEHIDGDIIVVFCHDDVYLHDWNMVHTLAQGLEMFDVVGVVGASNVPWGQPGWWFRLDAQSNPVRNDSVQLSGCLNHFDPTSIQPDYYGPSPHSCDLLDGVFLAARIQVLRDTGLRFDPQFRFHCYDSDFCYSAKRLNLRVGTWPLSITHGSPGEFGAPWVISATRLIQKLSHQGGSI